MVWNARECHSVRLCSQWCATVGIWLTSYCQHFLSYIFVSLAETLQSRVENLSVSKSLRLKYAKFSLIHFSLKILKIRTFSSIIMI